MPGMGPAQQDHIHISPSQLASQRMQNAGMDPTQLLLAMLTGPAGPELSGAAKTADVFSKVIKKLPIDKLIDFGDKLQVGILDQEIAKGGEKWGQDMIAKLSGKNATNGALGSALHSRLQEQLVNKELLERALTNPADKAKALAAGWDADITAGNPNAIQAMLHKLNEEIRQNVLFMDAAGAAIK